MNIIKSYAHIRQYQILVNDEVVFKMEESVTLPEFLSEAYKFLGLSYPKFHKMDAQCKLGLLATEFAMKDSNFLSENDLSKTAIVLSNRASSLDTDRAYQKSIDDKSNYFPSPAVFVYTLPNITIGELAIRYKITGENAFFVCDEFDASLLVNYAESLMKNGTGAIVGGWVQTDNQLNEAFIFLVETQKDTNKNAIFKPLNETTINTIYNQNRWTH